MIDVAKLRKYDAQEATVGMYLVIAMIIVLLPIEGTGGDAILRITSDPSSAHPYN